MSLYTRIIDLQKLGKAWNHVKKNKPAKGVDGVTYTLFDESRLDQLKQLHFDLSGNTYHVRSVKEAVIFREEKARTIALYCMRDKVVQQSIADELTKIYDLSFSDSVNAYRPDRSALSAVERIGDSCKSDDYSWFVRTDIRHFFDTINVNLLTGILRQRIREEDVLLLIKDNAAAPVVADDGSLHEKKIGIHQGSQIAPILSNIYLMQADRELSSEDNFYIRYSDDIIALFSGEKQAKTWLEKLKNILEPLGLRINDKKTSIGEISSGFTFLGYQFDKNGKGIPSKAENSLSDRLEGLWLTDRELSVEEKLKKSGEVVNGWKQYFRGEREPGSMYEYAAVLYLIRTQRPEGSEEYYSKRRNYHNENLSLLKWLLRLWKDESRKDLLLFEYEDYFEIAGKDEDKEFEEQVLDEAAMIYSRLVVTETEEDLTSLMQLYSDRMCFNRAQLVGDWIKRLHALSEKKLEPAVSFVPNDDTPQIPISLSGKDIEKYLSLFGGREDTYAVETGDAGKRSVSQIFEPLTPEAVRRHLSGEITIDTYVRRTNNTAKFCVVDIDISKKYLITKGIDIGIYLKKAALVARALQLEFRHIGLDTYAEESGYRGFHLWLFFTEWMQIRYINLLEKLVMEHVSLSGDEVTVEFFPNTSRFKADKPGQCVKLPYGIHGSSGKRSVMLDFDYNPINDPAVFLKSIVRYPISAIKKVLSRMDLKDTDPEPSREVDEDLSPIGDMPENIRLVLSRCNLMRHLCLKAAKTAYLVHQERLSILYIFGHMGEEGKAFVHQIMHFTVNYKYGVTQKFISRLPDSPISCGKLRENYSRLTAEIGCTCDFQRIKNCYPSPVLHALKGSSEESSDITIPTSRTLTKESEKKVYSQLNTSTQVKEILQKILEMKKQRRAIDKNIEKGEKELERLFDEAHIESIESDYGLLVRRKTEKGYEWVVEF